jgi:hypothetical protein
MKSGITAVLALFLTAGLVSCGASNSEQAKDFAIQACRESNSLKKMRYWSEARQLDQRWEYSMDANTDMLIYQAQLDVLKTFLNEYDTEFQRIQTLYSRASFTIIAECAALLQE